MPSKLLQKLLVLLALISIGVTACDRANSRNTSISTTHATRQKLTSWISSNGKVEPIEPYSLQSQLTTFIDSILLKQGAKVRRGQVLMVLDAKDLETDLAHARGDLLTAQDEAKTAATGGSKEELAQLENDLAKTEGEIARLKREGESLDRLYSKQAATRQEIEQNRIALERAQADKRLIEQKKTGILERSKVQGERASVRSEEARNAIRSLEEKKASARVTAPTEGTVYSLPVRAGTFVHPGDLLAELADLRRIRVRAFVDEPEIGLLREGQTVEILWDGLPNRIWTGRVEQLPKTIVSRGSRNVGEVLCSVTDANSELLPNTNVDVRIRTAERDNALTLPRSAVRTEENEHYVFVVKEGRLQKRNVKVGSSNSTHYEVLSGITETDMIALPSGSDLREGMPVTVTVS